MKKDKEEQKKKSSNAKKADENEPKKVPLKELLKKQPKPKRIGSTDNIDERFKQPDYRQKYKGKEIKYAETKNKEQAENKLLKKHHPEDNVQQESNAQKSKGHVYGIYDTKKETEKKKRKDANDGA